MSVMKTTSEKNVWDQLGSLIFKVTGHVRSGKVEVTIHDSRVVQLEIIRRCLPPTVQTKPESTTKQAA